METCSRFALGMEAASFCPASLADKRYSGQPGPQGHAKKNINYTFEKWQP